MSQILVEESALESIKAQVQRLQSERDGLLDACIEVVKEFDNPESGRYLRWAVDNCREIIDRCTTTPKVME